MADEKVIPIRAGSDEDAEIASFDLDPPAEVSGNFDSLTLKDASQLTAEPIAALLKAGASPREAIAQAPEAARALAADNKARRKLATLMGDFQLEDKEIAALVKGTLVQKLVDSDDDKVQMEAAKQLAGMPGVGLTSSFAKVAVNVAVLSDETATVLSKLES